MNAEQAGLGYPSENPPEMIPMDAEMMKGMAAVNTHIEALKARNEPDLNTSQGREKAAEVKLAEKKRKESNWFSRVTIDRGNGWKPIWGSAADEELRIYTLVDGDKHRFWGIKPVGMDIYDFWEKYDPDVRRYEDRQQETPVDPDAPTGPLIGEPPRNAPPSNKAAAKPKRRQKPSEVTPIHRIRKSTPKSTNANTGTPKSLAQKVDAGHLALLDQLREVPGPSHANGRPTRNKTAVIRSDAEQKSTTEDGGSAPTKRPRGRPATKTHSAASDSKRPRGRPPTRGKQAEKSPKQKRTPTVKGNARVTKSQQVKLRPSAPSTHKMRTRGKGPAELLRLP